MSKRAWLIFGAVQMVGCILVGYGTMLSESALVRGSWLSGRLLLLLGWLPAMVVVQVIHARARYVFLPVMVACNAILWMTCSALWRILRRGRPVGTSHKYSLAVAATALVFVVVNTILFLRPETCADCFFPYGCRSRFIEMAALLVAADSCCEDLRQTRPQLSSSGSCSVVFGQRVGGRDAGNQSHYSPVHQR